MAEIVTEIIKKGFTKAIKYLNIAFAGYEVSEITKSKSEEKLTQYTPASEKKKLNQKTNTLYI